MTDLVKIAQEWQSKGAVPIAIASGRKRPIDPSWQQSPRRTRAQLAAEFEGGTNIGLILGSPSAGLIDIDLDCPEAIVLAPWILPDTDLQHGRAGQPVTHWWYRVEGGVPTTFRRADLDGRVMLELRGTGGQTVIPPSRYDPDPENGEKGGRLSWHRDGWPLRIPSEELIHRVNELAAATLIARHWPGPGARHGAFLALAGGLCNLGWAEARATDLVLGVAATYGDDDPDIAAQVATTYAAHAAGREHTGWPALREHLGAEVVDAVLRWIGTTEDTSDTVGSELVWADLGEALLRPVPETQWLIHGLVYPGSICWLQGEPGAGKTFVLCAWLLEAVRAGLPVVYVDEEMGLDKLAERLQWMVVEDDRPEVAKLFAAQVRYAGLAGFSSEHRQALAEAANEIGRSAGRPGLVFFDSASMVLGNDGLSEDDNAEVSQWIAQTLVPLKAAGWGVVVLDHITKSKEGRGPYARGAGAKLAQSDNSWRAMQVSGAPFNENQIGRLLLRSMKDRFGKTEHEVTYRVGGDGRGHSICHRISNRVARPVVDARVKGGLSEMQERIIDYLSQHAVGREHAVITRVMRSHVQGDGTRIVEAAEELAKMPGTGVHCHRPGPGKALWWFEPTGTEIELDLRDT